MTSGVFELALFIRPDCGLLMKALFLASKRESPKKKQCHMQKSEIKE
jgi:hypothetical protein